VARSSAKEQTVLSTNQQAEILYDVRAQRGRCCRLGSRRTACAGGAQALAQPSGALRPGLR